MEIIYYCLSPELPAGVRVREQMGQQFLEALQRPPVHRQLGELVRQLGLVQQPLYHVQHALKSLDLASV